MDNSQLSFARSGGPNDAKCSSCRCFGCSLEPRIDASSRKAPQCGRKWRVICVLSALSLEELRSSYSKSLLTLIQRHPAQMLAQDSVKELFKKTVNTLAGNPSLDRIKDEMRRSVKELLCYAMLIEEEAGWVLKEFYLSLRELMMEKMLEMCTGSGSPDVSEKLQDDIPHLLREMRPRVSY